MGLYTNFESKVTKVAKKVAFVKRNKFPIIGVVSVLLAFLFSMLGTSGIIQSDLVLNKEEYIYGEALQYTKASAFISSVHYEYAEKGDNPTWSEVVPTTVGEYYMRTYTYNGYKVRRYGVTKEFRILPKEINLEVTSQSIVYGEEPMTNASQVLNRGDSIDTINLHYENLAGLDFNETNSSYTNVEINLASLKIVNERGIDVTSSYKISTEKQRIRINKRTLLLTSNNRSKEYDGTPLSDTKVRILSGSLASDDYFEKDPKAIGSITEFSDFPVLNEITPSLDGEDKIKIINPSLGNVTHLYNINYFEGFLYIDRRHVTINGPVYTTTYDGTYQTPPVNSYNASHLNVSGLAPTDRLTNVMFGFNSSGKLYGEHEFELSYDIVNNQGQDVKHNYIISGDPGRMIIEKKNLYITPNVSSFDNFDSSNQKYTKQYDGNNSQTGIESYDGLCPNDSIAIVDRPSHYNPDTYADITNGLSIRITNNSVIGGRTYTTNVTSYGYNIIYNKRSLEITKRDIILNIPDINLFETTNALNENIVSYNITFGSLLTVYNHKITFTARNSSTTLSPGNYNFFDYFNVSVTNNYGTRQDSYYNIRTNNPKINVQRAKFGLNINNPTSDLEKVYNGSSQSVTSKYSDGTLTINDEHSNLPSTLYRTSPNLQIEVSAQLTDIEEHFFTKNDVTNFSASYRLSVNKNGSTSTQTLALAKSVVDFEFYNNTSFKIKSREVNISFNIGTPKYYDGKDFDPNILVEKNRYTCTTGSLASGHKLRFEPVNGYIKDVGTYTSDDLKNSYRLKIFDSNDNDKTSNYNLNYSYLQPLVIKRASLTLSIKSRSASVSGGRTVGDLLTKTYNDTEVDVFNNNSNDYGNNYYSQIYNRATNIESDYTIYFNCSLGINPAKDVGTYDVIVKDFSLSVNDLYGTVFNNTNRDCIDITVENASGAYEIKKKKIEFEIPSLGFICDGSAIDYNFELNTSSILSQLLTNHTVEVTGTSISNPGTYTASQAGINFKIYDADHRDVTSNYDLVWTNKSSFRITAQDARVVLSRSRSFNPPAREYNGTSWNEASFYESITSPNAINDAKHTYSFEFRFKNGFIPDNYYDAGIITLYESSPASNYTDVYCIKTYSNGTSNAFIVRNVEYNVINDKYVVTSQKSLTITINDTVYWVNNNEYTYDLSTKAAITSIDGLANGDRVTSLSIGRGTGINGSDLDYGLESKTFNVANYSSFFSIEIYNDTRGKIVTHNYNITYAGTITYQKAKLSLRVASSNHSYNVDEFEIGNVTEQERSLPAGATYEVFYDYTTPESSFTSSNYTSSRVGSYSFSINSVRVYYNGQEITSFVDISFNSASVGRTTIGKSTLQISTGTFKLGAGFIYNLALPKVIKAAGFNSVKEFETKFSIEYGNLVDDPNGMFIITEEGNLVPIVEQGTTLNQVREIRIINNATGEDVTDCFNVDWVIGSIEIYDISI